MELRLCPFCGSKKIMVYVVDDGGPFSEKNYKTQWAVECEKCLADGPWAKSKSWAIRKWNKRIHEIKY